MSGCAPAFLVAGHITLDKVADGYALGGTAVYAALTACNLGCSVGLLTNGAPRQAETLEAHGICVHSVAAGATTVFENIYRPDGRVQFVRSVAGMVGPDDVPLAWRAAKIVHLGPVAQEVNPLLAGSFSQALVGITPQGWMRAWDGTGRVTFRPWEQAAYVLSRADALVFSEQDVQGDLDLLDRYVGLARLAVVTRGGLGCDLFVDGRVYRLPAYATTEVDPTGAGDVFAAAFFIHLHEHGDPIEAANFANCVASFSVEGPGTSAIPSRELVEARYQPLSRTPAG